MPTACPPNRILAIGDRWRGSSLSRRTAVSGDRRGQAPAARPIHPPDQSERDCCIEEWGNAHRHHPQLEFVAERLAAHGNPATIFGTYHDPR